MNSTQPVPSKIETVEASALVAAPLVKVATPTSAARTKRAAPQRPSKAAASTPAKAPTALPIAATPTAPVAKSKPKTVAKPVAKSAAKLPPKAPTKPVKAAPTVARAAKPARKVAVAVKPPAPAAAIKKPASKVSQASKPVKLKPVLAKPKTAPLAGKVAQPKLKAAGLVKAAVAVEVAKPAKPVKEKLVRDSFTMPIADYALIDALKQRALKAAHPAKKSELLRAGLQLLASLSDTAMLKALKNVPPLKTGRPKGK